MAAEDAPDAFDLDCYCAGEAPDLLQPLQRMPFEHPAVDGAPLAVRRGREPKQRRLGVPTDVDGIRDLAGQCQSLFWLGPPGEVAVDDDELRWVALQFVDHCGERRGVPVNVRDHREA